MERIVSFFVIVCRFQSGCRAAENLRPAALPFVTC